MEKKIIKYAWISILLGIMIFTFSVVFDGNPIIEFLSGAMPWVLLGLTFLFWIFSYYTYPFIISDLYIFLHI